MKKAIIIGIVAVIILLIFMPMMSLHSVVSAMGGILANGYDYTNTEEITCKATGTFKDKEIEKQREYVKSKIADKDLVNAVLGIYHVERKDINDIIKQVNKSIEYIKRYEMTNDKITDFDVNTYIQVYKYGTDYFNYLLKNDKKHDLKVAKEYQDLKENKGKFDEYDYQYSSRALSNLSDKCAVGTDGFPLDKNTYTINGVFPHYPDGTFHAGVDMVTPMSNKTYAIADGEVLYISTQCPVTGFIGNECGANGFKGGGNYVYYKVKTEDGTYSVDHCHLSKVYVKVGDKITKGQLIGLTGSSGNSSGAHLHIEIHKNVVPADLGTTKNLINPCEFIKGMCDVSNQRK